MGFAAVASAAEDLNAVKARMEKRLPQIDQLKAQGVVGENNRGMMELRGGNVDAGDAVAAENRDRGIVYAEIARQTGTSVEQVARHRARQIVSLSAPGVWLQKEDGSWYKK
ncbi:MAG TPA: YdbL family protein [Opitutus sp.]|nr:YdbL family protein [Opitutus sp.]